MKSRYKLGANQTDFNASFSFFMSILSSLASNGRKCSVSVRRSQPAIARLRAFFGRSRRRRRVRRDNRGKADVRAIHPVSAF